MDRLASGEGERHVADADGLITAADQMHFDAALDGVVESAMSELLDVEIGVTTPG